MVIEYCEWAHAWGEVVECTNCSDPACALRCKDCPYVSYWCQEGDEV